MFSTIGVSLIAEQTSMLDVDTKTMLWTLISFLLLIGVLGKFAWKPLLNALEKREQGIRDSIDEAAKLKAEAETILAEHRQKLESAEAEVKAIVEDGRQKANEMKDKILSEARTNAKNTVDRATREIDSAREQALASIRQEAVDLSVALASRVIDKSLSPKDHEELIRESLKDLKL